MSKITSAFVAIFAFIILTKAQIFGPGGPFGPSYGPSQFYQTFVIQSAANKLATLGLPEDLQAKVADVITNSETGFTVCNTVTSPGLPGLPPSPFNWAGKKCATNQLRNVLLQLSAIEKEAIARNATTTNSPTTNSDVSP